MWGFRVPSKRAFFEFGIQCLGLRAKQFKVKSVATVFRGHSLLFSL